MKQKYLEESEKFQNDVRKHLPPENPMASYSPNHVPSATQMGQVRIWQICDYQSKSGRKWDQGHKKLDYNVWCIK